MDDTGRTNAYALVIDELGNNNVGCFLGADSMGYVDVIGDGDGTSGDMDEQDSDKYDVFRVVSSGKVTGDDSGDVKKGSNENNADGTIARACNVYELGDNDGGRFLARAVEAQQRRRGRNCEG